MAELSYQQAIDALESAVSEPLLNRRQIKQAVADLIQVCDWMRDEAVEAVDGAMDVFEELNTLRSTAGLPAGCDAPPRIGLKCGCVVTVGQDATPTAIRFISACQSCSEVLHEWESEGDLIDPAAGLVN